MPLISEMIKSDLTGYTPVSAVNTSNPPGGDALDASSANLTDTSTRLMSTVGSNKVPVRGLMPIEFSSDCDMMNLLPYTPYHDKTWAYTYYALQNQRS